GERRRDEEVAAGRKLLGDRGGEIGVGLVLGAEEGTPVRLDHRDDRAVVARKGSAERELRQVARGEGAVPVAGGIAGGAGGDRLVSLGLGQLDGALEAERLLGFGGQRGQEEQAQERRNGGTQI